MIYFCMFLVCSHFTMPQPTTVARTSYLRSQYNCYNSYIVLVKRWFYPYCLYMKIDLPQTREQWVLDQLREKILGGKLPWGEFLSQRRLANETESSVISVRGALRQLENEGLIENIPRWGVRIPKETKESTIDRYLIRERLETLAAEKICGKLSAQESAHLLALAKELDPLIPTQESRRKFAQLHHEFHLYIAQCSRSPLLEKLLERVMNASFMLLNAQGLSTFVSAGGITEGVSHCDLAESIITGPVQNAVEAMRSHIKSGLQHELELL